MQEVLTPEQKNESILKAIYARITIRRSMIRSRCIAPKGYIFYEISFLFIGLVLLWFYWDTPDIWLITRIWLYIVGSIVVFVSSCLGVNFILLKQQIQ